jgi:hypothetical protein
MRLSKPAGGLVALVVTAVVVGALASLVRGLLGDLRALAVLALVLVALVVATLAGARSREWLANSYW